MKMNKKGFTLAELLIVVAIIAVLVAIAIPVFNTQLERSRQATDAANCRAVYAEAMANSMTNGGEGGEATSDAPMQSASWDKVTDIQSIGGVSLDDISKTTGSKMKCAIAPDGSVTFSAAN